MIRMSYDVRRHAVELVTSGYDRGWAATCQVFEESGCQPTYIGANKLRIPVWAFVGARHRLGCVLRNQRVEFELDEATHGLLTRAESGEARYEQAVARAPEPLDALRTRLGSVGFTRRSLTTHQLRDLAKLVSLPSGAAFSVPGAGKTTVALAFYYLKREPREQLLVVCPKNAFAAWEEQIRLCVSDDPDVVRLTGGAEAISTLLGRRPDIMLITYQQLCNVREIVAKHLFERPMFLFLDESHRIKRGYAGLWASTVLALAHLPRAKLIMSGTPLPNALSDIVPQFRFLYPEVPVNEQNIATLIGPVFVRTTKAELGLPPIYRRMVAIPMRPRQRHLYELMRSEAARQFAGLTLRDRYRLRVFGASVMRLLQLLSNPALLARSALSYPAQLQDVLEEGDSPKVEYVCDRARALALQGHKVVIWSGFVQNVEIIAQRLVDLGAGYIHGGVEAGSDQEADTREYIIKRFHDDASAQVLVANPAACAEGISLHTVCHHAIYVDRNYNAAQYLQSEDRIHRLGLASTVRTCVEIVYSPDSLDESVDRRLQAKVQRMARILNDPSLSVEPYTTDLDEDGLTEADVDDIIEHLKRA